MGQASGLPGRQRHQSLYITADRAIVTAAFFDLPQVATLSVVLYLTMGITILYGIIRHLGDNVGARTWSTADGHGVARGEGRTRPRSGAGRLS